MRSLVYAAGIGAALLALPALAQAPQGTPMNIRGKVVKLDGQTLTVKGRDGMTMQIMLAPDARVSALAHKKLSDIKDGDYIASTSMPGKDGKLHALEVHYLPPVAPELQGPWDLRKDSVMTNAHVTGMAKIKSGTDIALTYKGQTTDVVVDSKTVIVGPAPATTADLKPGKAIFVRALKTSDGMLMANNATVEKNGLKPPM